MNELLEAVIEIDRLKEKHKLSACQVFVLQILKSAEINKVDYNQMLTYFIQFNEQNQIGENNND